MIGLTMSHAYLEYAESVPEIPVEKDRQKQDAHFPEARRRQPLKGYSGISIL